VRCDGLLTEFVKVLGAFHGNAPPQVQKGLPQRLQEEPVAKRNESDPIPRPQAQLPPKHARESYLPSPPNTDNQRIHLTISLFAEHFQYSRQLKERQTFPVLAPRDRYQVVETTLTKCEASPLKSLWEKLRGVKFTGLYTVMRLARLLALNFIDTMMRPF